MRTERDLRGSTRVELNLPARLTTAAGVCISAELKNLSLSGAFFACHEAVRAGSRLCVEIEVAGGANALQAEMQVVRVNDEGLGCRFLALEPRSSARLRTLMSDYVRRHLSSS